MHCISHFEIASDTQNSHTFSLIIPQNRKRWNRTNWSDMWPVGGCRSCKLPRANMKEVHYRLTMYLQNFKLTGVQHSGRGLGFTPTPLSHHPASDVRFRLAGTTVGRVEIRALKAADMTRERIMDQEMCRTRRVGSREPHRTAATEWREIQKKAVIEARYTWLSGLDHGCYHSWDCATGLAGRAFL